MTGSIHELRRLAISRAGPLVPDKDLLRRFVDERDQIAFTELVRRHGALVFGVCRRILKDTHHAEDAFQAAFLVLSRKATSLRDPERLASWLYGVACRIALKARRGRERCPLIFTNELERADASSAVDGIGDCLSVLDEAIHALPAKYREPLVLCYFKGLSNAEAADRLRCPLGTIATRLARARDLLRLRLTRRGFAVTAALLLSVLERAAGEQSPSEALLIATIANVRGPIEAGIVTLMEGAMVTMKYKKACVVFSTLLIAGLSGLGWQSFHAGADEPRPPAANRPAPPATTAYDATIATPNFVVEGVPSRTARLIAEAAENHRKQQALQWLGKELPRWSEPCRINVRIDENLKQGSGATTFQFVDSKVEQAMMLEGSLVRVLSDLLPHEVTHTVLASHFRKPIPRWADEGIASLAESPEEQQSHERKLPEIVNSGRMMKLSKLFAHKDFPSDVQVFCCQSQSIARYLLEHKNAKTLIAFVKDGMDDDWNRAVKKHYGFATVDDLEEYWLESKRKRLPVEPPTYRLDEAKPLAVGHAPVTAMAQISKDGLFLRVTQPVVTTDAVTSYTLREANGAKYYEPVASYRQTSRAQVVMHRLAAVKATHLDGKPINAKDLADRLKTETAVLITCEDGKIDPFYLQLIKPGTIVVTLPPLIAPVLPPAPSEPMLPPATVEPLRPPPTTLL
jgi:RNA polymerase sigma factor (sigma-70 family)